MWKNLSRTIVFRVKQSEILFSAPVIFETITLIMTHLNYDGKKIGTVPPL
jgi:hypothetical protein